MLNPDTVTAGCAGGTDTTVPTTLGIIFTNRRRHNTPMA